MDTEHLFGRTDVFTSWWANLVGRILSVYAEGFAVLKQDATHVHVPASAGVGAAIVAVQGRLRYVEADVSRAHPGGAAGTYDVFVTAKETTIVGVPAPYTDTTDYSFALAITAHGATPPIVPGAVDVFRKVAELSWDGAQITTVTQLVPVLNASLELIGHKDQPNGYAGLDGGGKLHPAEFPQSATVGETAGYRNPAGGAYVTVDGTFTGGVGATGYTIGDVVAALKQIGVFPP